MTDMKNSDDALLLLPEIDPMVSYRKVRPRYFAEIPASDPVQTKEGIWICPVADLVRMKLTSFLLKDKVHIQDLDGVGLITPEIEAALPQPLRERLQEVRTLE